jgi:hypothetical protein
MWSAEGPFTYTRRMRLRLGLALLALPGALASYLAACSSEQPIEDLCGWLGDENNCYRKFAEEIGAQCGTAGLDSAKLGYFLKRDRLDICVFKDGGQVIFDPPLDVAKFPVETAGFAILDDQATLCGAWAMGLDGAFAASVASVPSVPDGGTCEKDGGTSDGGVAPPGSEICGGAFSARPVTARELVDTQCPSGESHHFNRLQLARCPEVDQLFPRAEIESNAGSINIDGFVRFRVYYPPATGALENANPEVVEYFNCIVPGALPTCQNGVVDPDEADKDCGALCPTKCKAGLRCRVPIDCESGNCEIGPDGFRRCDGILPPGPAHETRSLITNVVLPRRSRSLSRSWRRSPGGSFCSFRNVPLRELSSSMNA